MDWDDIRLFLALARTRRLGAASRVVAQNATTVARRIQRMERTLQTTLFENTVAGYVLTQDGQALLQRAERIEREALEIAQVVGRGGTALSGPIRVSVSEGFGSHVLAPRLASFTAEHPGITVDLIASTGILNPSRREADIAVMLSRPKAGPLLVRKLTDYRLALYAHPSFLAKAAPIRDVSDLLDRTLIGYVPDLVAAPELHYLAELDPRLQASVRSSSINAQAELIAAGAGCGILPTFIADRTPGLMHVLPEAVAITRTFWLVVHRDVRQIARIERFIGWLYDTVAAAGSIDKRVDGRPDPSA
jgi:DNA-binding transcriptional LysR family regulator